MDYLSPTTCRFS